MSWRDRAEDGATIAGGLAAIGLVFAPCCLKAGLLLLAVAALLKWLAT